eukprot:1375610-Amphidinium_carterae.3
MKELDVGVVDHVNVNNEVADDVDDMFGLMKHDVELVVEELVLVVLGAACGVESRNSRRKSLMCS